MFSGNLYIYGAGKWLVVIVAVKENAPVNGSSFCKRIDFIRLDLNHILLRIGEGGIV